VTASGHASASVITAVLALASMGIVARGRRKTDRVTPTIGGVGANSGAVLLVREGRRQRGWPQRLSAGTWRFAGGHERHLPELLRL